MVLIWTSLLKKIRNAFPIMNTLNNSTFEIAGEMMMNALTFKDDSLHGQDNHKT